jgi:hypothetical protein
MKHLLHLAHTTQFPQICITRVFWFHWTLSIVFQLKLNLNQLGNFEPLDLNVFPWGSPSSQVVPQDIPIAPQIFPIQFAQSSTLMDINWKGWPFRCTFFLLCDTRSKEVLLWRSVQCSKKLDDGSINMGPLWNKRKSYECVSMNQIWITLCPTRSRTFKTSSSFGN